MHKIQEKEFTWDDFSWEHLRRVRNSHLGDTVPTLVMESTINGLNFWRNRYLEIDRDIKLEREKALNMNSSEPMVDIKKLKEKQKEAWWQMIQLLPSSYNQTRNVMMNYEVLANIYKSRKNHKLDEWREFCKWIESLPYTELICGDNTLMTLNEQREKIGLEPVEDIERSAVK